MLVVHAPSWPEPDMEFNAEGDLPGTLSLRVFGSPAALAQAVAGRVREAVMTGVRLRGHASLMLDAAAVLRPAYRLLTTMALPWADVRIRLSDEAGAADANAGLGREDFMRHTLMQGAAAAAQFTTASPGHDATSASEHDLVLLAMAPDGGIAALVSIEASATTFGKTGLLDSRRVVIVGQGLAARDVFERQALAGDAAVSALQAFAHEATQPVEFCWCR